MKIASVNHESDNDFHHISMVMVVVAVAATMVVAEEAFAIYANKDACEQHIKKME